MRLQEHASIIWDNCFANCAGAVSLSLRGAEDASTIRKTMPGKAVELSETVARRRRKFFRISTSGLYFIKENRHETSPPQANFFKGFEVLKCIFVKEI